jgi:hypothetical protein
MKKIGVVLFGAAVFLAGYWSGSGVRAAHAQTDGRVFELRTYHANQGKLEALETRFRDHALELFKRHHMTSVGYWLPTDDPADAKTLVYILAFPSREAAKKSWADFFADPDWKKAARESELNGKLVSKVDSTFMTPADFSPIK